MGGSMPDFVKGSLWYPGANRVVHHWGRENGGRESFALSRLISRRFSPVPSINLVRPFLRERATPLPAH
jgi:hypothetical protein